MPDVLHWLGIAKIDRLVSMSDVKFNAITQSGIAVGQRVPLPEDRIPEDAHVEMTAKKAAGYYSDGPTPNTAELTKPLGRTLTE
jgi:GTP cyclohydrolase II